MSTTDHDDDKVARLERRAAKIERTLDNRARERMTASERQAAALGFEPARPSHTDDEPPSASERQAAQLRSAATSTGYDWGND